MPTSTDSLALLEALPSSSFLVRVTSLPIALGQAPTWRLEHSEDAGGTWSSLEPGQPGRTTAAAAIEAGAKAIEAWRAARLDAEQAEVYHFFTQGKLERRKIQVLDEDNSLITIDGYAAQSEEGNWIEDMSPIVAINKAKTKVKHSSGSKQG